MPWLGTVGERWPSDIEVRPVNLPDESLEQLEELDVSLTFQNTHNYYFADFHLDNTLGPERTSRLTPLKSAMDRGFSVTAHHDSPVHPVSQLMLIWIAANRASRSGMVYGPDERISVYRALQASTINAAWQFREEKRKGTLEAGKLADLVILDQNPLKTPLAKLLEIKVVETIKQGKTVFRKRAGEPG